MNRKLEGNDRVRVNVNLKNISNVDNEGIWDETHREPNAIFLNLEPFHSIELVQDGQPRPVGVRPQTDDQLRRRAWRIIRHPHRLHSILEQLLHFPHLHPQSSRGHPEQRHSYLFRLFQVRFQRNSITIQVNFCLINYVV